MFLLHYYAMQELSDLGKPKGPRNAINIYIIDHYVRTEGNTALVSKGSLAMNTL